MKHIFRKISLEQYKSRMPGMIDSYSGDDSFLYSLSGQCDYNSVEFIGDNVCNFTKETIRKENHPTSNYGMFPKDIYIKDNNKQYSYSTFKKLYRFMVEYNLYLKVMTKCGKKEYDSYLGATSFSFENFENYQFDDEYFYNKYYFIPRESSIDAYYNSIGGNEFYEWCNTNAFPKFIIPIEYVDEWETEELFLPDFLKWYAWFEEMHNLCKTPTDDTCCDCSKYNRLGGNSLYAKMQEFWENLSFNVDTEDAFINLQIEITNSIDDIGEFSIFSSDWENLTVYNDEYDQYHTSGYSRGGTVVTYNENAYMLKDATKMGYKFDDKYLVGEFKNEDWDVREIQGLEVLKRKEGCFEYTDENKTEFITETLPYWSKYDYVCNKCGDLITEEEYNKLLDDKIHDECDGEYVKIKSSGYTESKLSNFVNYNISCDDMGNALPGYFNTTNGKTAQPKEGDTLEMFYRFGETANVEETEDGKYWGDIIVSATFYYLRDDGKKVGIQNASKTNSFSRCVENLIEKEIELFEDEDEENNKVGGLQDTNIYVDITYCCGAILTKNGDDYKINDGDFSGVTYIDTCTVVKKNWKYMLTPDEGYYIQYYDLEHEKIETVMNDYNNTIVYIDKAYFETYLSKDIKDKTKEDSNNKNGFVSFPVLREEHNFGISSLQNVDGNIYINRGINQSFEKHLKLQEIKSFEALENYGNGSFNIIES